MASDPNEVEPCKGWKDACSFCDKRFCNWREVGIDSEEGDITLTKPSAFMFAYQTKQGKEVVSIGIHSQEGKKQNTIGVILNELRSRIANKAFKETKSTIHFRSAPLGSLDSKDSCVLFAHWCNHLILPRLATEWPGLRILESSQFLKFSSINKKWCYVTREAVWKQQKKSNTAPRAIKKCKGWTENCNFCDTHLTPWVSAEECLEKKMAPDLPGYLLLAGNNGNTRETVCIVKSIGSIKKTIDYQISDVRRHLHNDHCRCVPADTSKTIDVRWIVQGDKKIELPYLLVLAHWINNGTLPVILKKCRTYDKPFDDAILLEHGQFVFRERDKQWCYVADEEDLKAKRSNPKHTNKNKSKYMMNFDDDDLYE